MTDRPTASTITDAQLDALHERVLYAEAAVRRASALATRWDFILDRKRAAIELRNELRRRAADTASAEAVDWSKVKLTVKRYGVLPAPDPAAPLRAVAAAALRDGTDAVLRQSPQTAAAAPTPSAPSAAPGARVAAEHPLPGVSGPSGGEIGAQTGAQSLALKHGHPGRPCFPDPTARCSAHGDTQCTWCHQNPADCLNEYGNCSTWSAYGMHWDTCRNRIRSAPPDEAADEDDAPQPALAPHTGHGSPCEDSPDGTCAAPAPPAGRCAARLDRDGEHWACDRPTGHPGGHSAGEPWAADYNAWTDRAAGASPAPPAGALRDQLTAALRGYGFITRAEAIADAVLPVIEQHTARLRNLTAEAEAQAELTRGELVNTRRELAAAEAELRRVSALHDDTVRQLRADLADEVRKREEAAGTARTLGATVSGVHEYVQDLDQMAESTASSDDRRLYRALAADLRKRLDYEAVTTPKETPHD